MKSCQLTKPLLAFVLCFFSISSNVFALAGFSEQSTTLYYNEYADIRWMSPSDNCSPYGYDCFYLIEKNGLKYPFNKNLRQINVPEFPDDNFLIMQAADRNPYSQDKWIVYDLKSDGIILETDDYLAALREWRRQQNLDYIRPELVDAKNLGSYFEETKAEKAKSRKESIQFLMENWPISLIFFCFLIGAVAVIITAMYKLIRHLKFRIIHPHLLP